jgi:hypothetical protein
MVVGKKKPYKKMCMERNSFPNAIDELVGRKKNTQAENRQKRENQRRIFRENHLIKMTFSSLSSPSQQMDERKFRVS